MVGLRAHLTQVGGISAFRGAASEGHSCLRCFRRVFSLTGPQRRTPHPSPPRGTEPDRSTLPGRPRRETLVRVAGDPVEAAEHKLEHRGRDGPGENYRRKGAQAVLGGGARGPDATPRSGFQHSSWSVAVPTVNETLLLSRFLPGGQTSSSH